MAFANSERNSTSSPIDKYLEYRKWVFSCWNKETSSNEVHELNNFIILDVVYTIKWAEWNDALNQYTSRYYSNEIREFKDKLYLIRMTFSNWQANKDLVISWQWKQHIKPVLPKWAALNLWLVIYDLNDKSVKEVFLQGNSFYKVSQFIKWITSNNVLSFKSTVWYTDWKTDKDWNDIIVDEAYVDSLKWTEAAKYKKRYILDIENTWLTYDDNDDIQAMAWLIDEHYLAMKKAYIDKYDNWKVEELQPWEFAVPDLVKEEESKATKEVATIKEDDKKKDYIDWDISIEDVPW
jgi:hypothetical protein